MSRGIGTMRFRFNGMTTVNDIMNIGRAINAGEVTFYTDATFGICKNEVCLVGVWVGKRCDGTVIVGYSK